MDISGLIQSYDSRAASSAALTRTITAPHYIPIHNFSGANSNALVATHQQIQQHNPFGFGAYTAGGPNQIIPAFAANNYVQQRPLPRLMQPENDGRGMPFSRSPRQGYIEEHHSRSPPIKSEPQWNVSSNSPSFVASNSKNISPTSGVNGINDANFGTEVDTLMKAIQAKAQSAPPQKTPSGDQSRPVDDAGSAKGGKKRYQCTIENCTKSFYQKTHLDIHERAHTGVKPYPCKEPDCGRSFSQLGNLKTHERRHTGERPYTCEICGKRFAQRGNVRAHKIVHDQSKPYLCRLDECGKQFTQLGNLKSHQNKFHIATIRTLTSKFASIKDGDLVHAADKELWEYFANLYKNSNKGIKGRGKDRKVGSNSMLSSGMRNLGVGGRGGGGYNMSGSGRGNMINTMGANMGAHGAGRGEGGQYDMFDVDTESQGSHSGSGGASSVGTCYDDAPSDGFEDTGRSNDLAFGDRIY